MPKNPKKLGDAEFAEVESFLGALDDDDDVQTIVVALAE